MDGGDVENCCLNPHFNQVIVLSFTYRNYRYIDFPVEMAVTYF
jgi:hypothetical protein